MFNFFFTFPESKSDSDDCVVVERAQFNSAVPLEKQSWISLFQIF
jgi:hypothetical protein